MRCPYSRIFPTVFAAVSIVLLVAARASASPFGGRVVDADRHGIARATVLILHGDAIVATAKTADDGTFGPLDLPAGRYDVLVAAAGVRTEPQHVTLGAGGQARVDLVVSPTAASDSVVVTAAQVDVPLSRTTESVTVITSDDIERRQLHTVADALRDVPGFAVAAGGTPGGVTSVFPRGGESNYTLVLVDGIPQNAMGGGFDFAHLSTADVDRIEVVRGPASALFGAGAIGGLVDVITKHGGPLRGEASFEGGGYGTGVESVSGGGSRGAWHIGAAFSHETTDGDTRVFASAGGRVSNDFYRRTDGSITGGWSDGPSRSVDVTFRAGQNDRGAPGAYGSDPQGLFQSFGGLDTQSHGTNATREVGVAALFGAGTPLRHHIDATWAALDSKFFSIFDIDHPSLNNTHRATGRYQLDFGPSALPLSAGAEFVREQADNTFITTTGSVPVPVRRHDAGLFVEARPNFGSRVSVTAGARVERIDRSPLAADDPGAFNPRPALPDDVVWSANPRVSALWTVRPSSTSWTKIHGSAGTGIRPPTAFELAFTDNPNLKPERNRSAEGGIEQALAGSRVVVDATAFANRYEDVIVTVGTALAGLSRYRTDNLANASSRGLELSATWKGPAGFSARGTATFLHTEVLGVTNRPDVASKPYYQVGDSLVRRPARSGSVELDWASGRTALFIAVNGRSRMADLEPNLASAVFQNPGYSVVGIGGSFTIARGVSLYGRVDNLFNRAYEEVLGFPALGRAGSVGLRVAGSR